jgi:hypothetical protein
VKDPATLPKEALKAIRSMREHITERGHVTIEVQLWDKVAALGLLARATGLHVSRAEVSTGTASLRSLVTWARTASSLASRSANARHMHARR